MKRLRWWLHWGANETRLMTPRVLLLAHVNGRELLVVRAVGPMNVMHTSRGSLILDHFPERSQWH